MSVLLTESFMRYARRATDTGEVNNDLVAGGLPVRAYTSNSSYPPTTPIATTMRLEVITDPVYSARNALVSAIYGSTSATRAASIPFNFSSPQTHYIFGARVRLEPSTETLTNITSLFLTIGPAGIAKNTGSTTNNPTFARPAAAWETALSFDLITGLTETGVSNTLVSVPYSYVTGSDVYVEVEIDTVANLVRVWIDDLLVVDSIFDAGILAAAKAAYDQGFGIMVSESSTVTNTYVKATIRDVYCLAVDAVTPFQRLGPTTQVIGELPTDDAQAQFTRPGGYTSNAEVAALPVTASPADYLTADSVDQEDRYTVATSGVATAAAQVYAVGVKTQVANFAAASHNIGAIVKDGVDTETIDMGTVSPGSGFVNRAAYFTTNPATDAAWTPQEAADAEFGLKVLS